CCQGVLGSSHYHFPTRRASDLAERLRTTTSERPRCADMPAASLSCQPYSYAPIEAMISSSVCFSPVGWAVPAASWVGALMVVLRSEEHTSELQSRENLV